MYGALFVSDQNVANVVLLKNFVIDRQHSTTWISKYGIDALIFQGLDDHFCSGHLACHSHSLRFQQQVLFRIKKAPGFGGGAWGLRNGDVTDPCAL